MLQVKKFAYTHRYRGETMAQSNQIGHMEKMLYYIIATMRVPLFINECKLIEVEERQLMSRHLVLLLLNAMERPTVLPGG